METAMDNTILKKRLNTFRSARGTLTRVSDEVIMELLRSWEAWPGTSADFYRDIGLSKQQLAILIKKGKKLVKNGIVTEGEFKEIPLNAGAVVSGDSGKGVVMKWDKGKLIRFSDVDQLVDFLKKVA